MTVEEKYVTFVGGYADDSSGHFCGIWRLVIFAVDRVVVLFFKKNIYIKNHVVDYRDYLLVVHSRNVI